MYVICHLDFQRIIVTIVTIQMYVSFNPPFEFSLEKGNLKQADLSRSLLICSLAKVYTHHLNLLLDYVLYLPIKPYLIIWWKGEFRLLMMMIILMLSKMNLKSLLMDIFNRKCDQQWIYFHVFYMMKPWRSFLNRPWRYYIRREINVLLCSLFILLFYWDGVSASCFVFIARLCLN